MIDFTTVQLNPVPPPIIELQQANNNLKAENKIFSTTLWVIALGGLAVVSYMVYIEYQKNTAIRINNNKPEKDPE